MATNPQLHAASSSSASSLKQPRSRHQQTARSSPPTSRAGPSSDPTPTPAPVAAPAPPLSHQLNLQYPSRFDPRPQYQGDSNSSTTSSIMPQYTSRDVGDPSQIKKNKQSMADLKLRRLTELNSRLREDLERERIPVSQASKSIIAYCNSTRDYMVPSVWGAVPRGEDPYAPQQSGGCCSVM
ncbi:putative G protein gamma subunit [Apiospora arundinis]|uniref:Guanine nucleotide-binding protein subunit gamma n=1 Tax=Apiospora arundinis TaxID=335852 RepID=A0ABR2JA60_9PEZI